MTTAIRTLKPYLSNYDPDRSVYPCSDAVSTHRSPPSSLSSNPTIVTLRRVTLCCCPFTLCTVSIFRLSTILPHLGPNIWHIPLPNRASIDTSRRGIKSFKGGHRLPSRFARTMSTAAANSGDDEFQARQQQSMLASQRRKTSSENASAPTEENRRGKIGGYFTLGYKEGFQQWVTMIIEIAGSAC